MKELFSKISTLIYSDEKDRYSRILKKYLNYFRNLMFKGNSCFNYNGNLLHYFFHPYNSTFENERAIEIPILKYYIKKHETGRILEVGNVTQFYFDFFHDIVDQYEIYKGVINEDIIKFAPKQKYDFVFSISTIEHVGWDYGKKDPKKIIAAVKKLKSITKKGGEIVITIPLGFSDFADKLVKSDVFDECFVLKRINLGNDWVQVDSSILHKKVGFTYGHPFKGANWMVIGVINK